MRQVPWESPDLNVADLKFLLMLFLVHAGVYLMRGVLGLTAYQIELEEAGSFDRLRNR
jgi:hypothetical protein